jgi:hypothetical protein
MGRMLALFPDALRPLPKYKISSAILIVCILDHGPPPPTEQLGVAGPEVPRPL